MKSKYLVSKIGQKVKAYRKMRMLSVRELSEASKVNYNTIIKLESGFNTNPTVKTLIGLSTALKMPIDNFIK